jgi:hypothetical protein
VSYSIQTGSFLLKDTAEIQYAEIEQMVPYEHRRNLRIEYIDPYYTVRFGKFSDYETAQKFLAEIPNPPDVIIVRAFYMPERFILSNLSEMPASPSQDAQSRQQRLASIVTQAGNIHGSVAAVTRTEEATDMQEYPHDSGKFLDQKISKGKNLRELSFTYIALFVGFVAVMLIISMVRRSHNRAQNSMPFNGSRISGIPGAKILEDHRFTILMNLQAHPPKDIDEACRMIEGITGTHHNPNDIRRFIKSLGHLT